MCTSCSLHMCRAFRKESAVPAVAIPASSSADVQPLPSSKFPSALRSAIFMCNPPNMTTNACSPCVSFHVHWIFFASLNRGWSQVMTGTCPGLRTATAFLITFIECRIIAIDLGVFKEKREKSTCSYWGMVSSQCLFSSCGVVGSPRYVLILPCTLAILAI